ncbi:hypothetical protein [Paenibacillus sp. sgz5001063]|uniref:hypothetical protein n=1 Tax=Paenibacillus sp. sgz5001063 TaxID=3242474 RepID=UPI0036D36F29
MKSLIPYISIVWLALILSGCTSNEPNNTSPNVPANSTSTPLATISPTVSPKDVFETGVFIDLDTLEDPLFNDEIKLSLQSTLEGLAEKNEQLFRSAFVDEQTANAFMYLLGKEYRFDKVGTILKDNPGRIVVEVRGLVKDDSGVHEPNAYYYFVLSDQNKWALGAID